VSESGRVDRASGRLIAGAWALALAVGIGGALEVSPEHRLMSGTGGLAITLLLSSLACSPAATLLAGRSAATAVALRRARRWLGLSATLAAAVHASLATWGYLGLVALGPFLSVHWIRHGALALLVLGALSLTSFPPVTRTLRVRAWSALHRWVYLAALLAGLHALGTPFGDVGAGVFALATTLTLLVARPIAAAVALRRARPPSVDP
jgi:methionine sulfoxide reductase heme-binding subunit